MRIVINTPYKTDFKRQFSLVRNYLDLKSYDLEDFLFSRCGKWFWSLHFTLTGRCGGRRWGHTPIYGNAHLWLWKNTPKQDVCTACGERVRKTRYANNSAKHLYLAKTGRETDMKQLARGLATATNEQEKLAVRKSMDKINREDKHVGAMREALIKATREGDHERIKDIHETIGGDRKYNNG